MSYPLKATNVAQASRVSMKLPTLASRRGTHHVENNNKYGARATVKNVTRQGSSVTHRKFLLFATKHNLKCDAKIAHLTGKKPWSRDWFIREALHHDIGHLVYSEMFPGEEYPPEIEKEKHMEWNQLANCISYMESGLALIG